MTADNTEPTTKSAKPVFIAGWRPPNLIGNLYTRMHYAGQFWIGIAAWLVPVRAR